MKPGGRLECWSTPGGTVVCIECSARFTGSVPVALLSPRRCRSCKKEITDEWPSDQVDKSPEGLE